MAPKTAASPAEAPAEDKPVVVTERKSATKPIIAADGHVVLSQDDIDARDNG